MAEIRFGKAINQALFDAMAADERVFVLGEDVAAAGGSFKVTRDLMDAYPGRVLDTPIAEASIAGIAVGAALTGMRPFITTSSRKCA